MITAMLVSMVVLALVIASLALAVHDNNQSGQARNRTAALHAAEAGLHDELTCLASPSGPSVSVAAGGCGGATGASSGVCGPTVTKTLSAGLPIESYQVTVSGCAGGNTRKIVSTGSVVSATGGTAITRTVAASVSLVGSDHISGGARGGYPLTEAIMSFAGGSPSTYSNLVVTGTTAVPTVHIVDGSSGGVPQTAVFTSGALFGSLKVDGGGVTVTNTSPVGGDIVANGGVTLTGVNLLGNLVSAAGAVTLNTSSVNQDVRTAATSVTNNLSTINGRTLTGAVTNLPAAPPAPTFNNTSTDWATITGNTAVTASCPPASAVWSGVYQAGGACTLGTPTSFPNPVVIIADSDITMTAPPLGSGQLYLISTGGKVTINGNSSPVNIFAYGKMGVTTTGNLTGQLMGAPVNASNGTLTYAPPTIPPPDFSFPSGTVLAPQFGYAPTIDYQYVCASAAIC